MWATQLGVSWTSRWISSSTTVADRNRAVWAKGMTGRPVDGAVPSDSDIVPSSFFPEDHSVVAVQD
jgi:hypothetical protein